MEQSLVLTFDVGTQSARCLLVNESGDFEDKEQQKYKVPYLSKQPGWAEQTPDFYFNIIAEMSKKVIERNADKLDRITAVCLTCIRDTVLCLDKDKRPLRDIILWLDEREADEDGQIPAAKRALFSLVGMGESVDMIYRASTGNWIMQNEPEIWAKTDKYVMLPSYLNYLLTGELKDSVANMIGHVPFDYKNRRWMKPGALTRCVCNVPPEKLCELVPSGEVIGKITKDASEKTGIPMGLPLIATGSDKGCETIGMSVVKSNRAAISFGTTSTLQMAVKKYFEPQPYMPAYPAVPNDMFNPEFEVYRGFWMISWFIEQFAAKDKVDAAEEGVCIERYLDDKIKNIEAGSGGLILQPFWTPGITNPNASGAIIGFSDFHTRYHLYRAIIEGICLELYHGLVKMQKRSSVTVDELYAGGGGSSSPVVCQIAADVFGLPVHRIQTHEASAVGCAMVAFISQGVYGSYEDAIKHMVHKKDVFIPNEENHRTYMKIYGKAYSHLASRLKPIEKYLHHFQTGGH